MRDHNTTICKTSRSELASPHPLLFPPQTSFYALRHITTAKIHTAPAPDMSTSFTNTCDAVFKILPREIIRGAIFLLQEASWSVKRHVWESEDISQVTEVIADAQALLDDQTLSWRSRFSATPQLIMRSGPSSRKPGSDSLFFASILTAIPVCHAFKVFYSGCLRKCLPSSAAGTT